MTLSEFAELVGGRFVGPPDLEVGGPVSLDAAAKGGIAFAENEAYLSLAESSQASALLLPDGLRSDSKPYVCVTHPRAAFLKLLEAAHRPMSLSAGIHPAAMIGSGCIIDASASVGAYVVVEAGATIGARAKVYPFAYIGERCEVQEDCAVYPHAVLYADVKLGPRTVVHAGAVLGADGFGYAPSQGKRTKVPQIGSVEIGADCEIGALTAIDRATLGSTRIGAGTKLDNLVQVAHNVQIGDHCAVAAQAGIAGSSRLGDRVLVAGQAGVGDHVVVVSDVVLEARTAALQDIDEPGRYIGTPARPSGEAKRALLLMAKLPELFSRMRKLEKRLDER